MIIVVKNVAPGTILFESVVSITVEVLCGPTVLKNSCSMKRFLREIANGSSSSIIMFVASSIGFAYRFK